MLRSGVFTGKRKSHGYCTVVLTAKKEIVPPRPRLRTAQGRPPYPGIIYGLNKDPEMVEVSSVDMRAHLSQRTTSSNCLDGAASQKVMLKAVERDPIRRDLVHIDFLRVDTSIPSSSTFRSPPSASPSASKPRRRVLHYEKFVKLRAKVQDIRTSST